MRRRRGEHLRLDDAQRPGRRRTGSAAQRRGTLRRGSPILVLADVNDPANAGTLLRSADAFGCAGVRLRRASGSIRTTPRSSAARWAPFFGCALRRRRPAEAQRGAPRRAGAVCWAWPSTARALTEVRMDGPRLRSWSGTNATGWGRWESLCERTLAIPDGGPSGEPQRSGRGLDRASTRR